MVYINEIEWEKSYRSNETRDYRWRNDTNEEEIIFGVENEYFTFSFSFSFS